MDTFWEWAGKASVLIGAVWGVLKIWGHFRKPKPSLVATVTSHPIYLQHVVNQKLKSFYDHYQHAYKLGDDNLEQLLQLTSQGGEWMAEVTNTDQVTCTDVSITLPKTRFAWVIQTGKESKLLTPANEQIEIGQLQAGDKATVYAWTSMNLGLAAGFYQKDNIKLRHSKGMGKIKFRPLFESSIFQGKTWWDHVSMLLILIVVGLSIWGAIEFATR